jgi:hypothetical protein
MLVDDHFNKWGCALWDVAREVWVLEILVPNPKPETLNLKPEI